MAKSKKTGTTTSPAITGNGASNGAIKTKCPISRADFDTHSRPLSVTVDGQALDAAPRAFSTGSMGYMGNGKVTVTINGVPVKCQVSILVTVIGSKELPQG
jgi:hypothetical protein